VVSAQFDISRSFTNTATRYLQAKKPIWFDFGASRLSRKVIVSGFSPSVKLNGLNLVPGELRRREGKLYKICGRLSRLVGGIGFLAGEFPGRPGFVICVALFR